MLNPYKFHSDPETLFNYNLARQTVPEIAWEMATTNEQKRKLRHLWAQDPKLAYLYALDVIEKPWKPGEAAIATEGRWAYYYADHVLEHRFEPGEAAIARDSYFAYRYAIDVLDSRFPQGEAAIARDPARKRDYERLWGVKL